MNRRIAYLIGIVVFALGIVWYATGFSGLPTVDFANAAAIADTVTNSKVLVVGHMQAGKDVTNGGEGLTFYLQDESGKVERVVYDGSEEISPADLKAAQDNGEEVKVAGHICSDGEGARFHAKNIYLSN